MIPVFNKENTTEVGPDEYPFYVPAEKQEEEKKSLSISDIPQGPSSGLDSDTVDGVQVSRTSNPAPNTLIPLDADGMFPSSVIPSTTTLWSLMGEA